jgi:hypothetical protein
MQKEVLKINIDKKYNFYNNFNNILFFELFV